MQPKNEQIPYFLIQYIINLLISFEFLKQITSNFCFEPGILQSKVAFPPIGIETLAIGEIGSASIFWRNIKLVRLQEVIY